MTTSSTRKGVRLTLAGAPNHPHRVQGLNVLVSPTEPTPVDDEQAQRVQELIDQGADLELVALDAEPWRGYGQRSAEQIVKALAKADAQKCSVVIAFESAQNQPRRTVIDAAAARISELEG